MHAVSLVRAGVVDANEADCASSPAQGRPALPPTAVGVELNHILVSALDATSHAHVGGAQI